MPEYCGQPYWVQEKPCNKWQKAGLRYEARVIKKIQKMYGERALIRPNQWIAYEHTWCQADCILIPHDPQLNVVVVEVKLKQRDDAEMKLRNLYSPLVQDLEGKLATSVQITRCLSGDIDQPIYTLDQLFEIRDYGVVFCS